MAVFQFTKKNASNIAEPTGQFFDDSATALPGDTAFPASVSAAQTALATASPAADGFNYVGASAGAVTNEDAS